MAERRKHVPQGDTPNPPSKSVKKTVRWKDDDAPSGSGAKTRLTFVSFYFGLIQTELKRLINYA
jgi:hypothetical protein